MARLRNFVRKMVHEVLELCCFEWFQNVVDEISSQRCVLELCCFEWFQNCYTNSVTIYIVLELCCFEWFQNNVFCGSCCCVVLELCCFEWFQNSFLLIRGRPCSFIAVLFILPSYDAFFLK